MNPPKPAYFDYAATTPVDPRVAELIMNLMIEEFGNAGSRTHEFGTRAARAGETARTQVASVVDADPAEVIFTSGATESDNLAILGLAAHGEAHGLRHIVSTSIEHKAVLEPLEFLAEKGFTIDLISPNESGAVNADDVLSAVREDTLLVSVMHVNNETGIRQPLDQIAAGLSDSPTFFHTDAAQGFGKDLAPLTNKRLDLISISGHKVYASKGVGALITRRRNRELPPLTPLQRGGGQERGMRPGTLPVNLVAGLGLSSALALEEAANRQKSCENTRLHVLELFASLGAEINGDPDLSVPHIVNASFPGLDSEAVILALREVLSFSNGSACTSASYEPSHVLTAMGLSDDARRGAIRLSWSHDSVLPDSTIIEKYLKILL